MIEIPNNWKATALTASAAAATGIAASYVWQNYISKKSFPTPQKWIRVGTVKNLIVYPIKSCKGTYVEEALPVDVGLKVTEFLRDRVFVVVDKRSVFQSQRVLPRMALINVNVRGNQVTLNAEGMEEFICVVPETKPALKRSCRIHDDRVAETYDCGPEVGKWLDTFLEQDGLRLLFHASEKTQRAMVPLQKKFPYFRPNDKGSFQDQTSYLMIADESVAALNEKSETLVTHRNFRPNILIHQIPEAFAEDVWTFVRIGDQNGPIFKTAKQCTRCKLTTVDPETGDFYNTGEPIKSLTEIRRDFGDERLDHLLRNLPVIGIQAGLFKPGKSIRIGDPVYAAAL